MKEKTSCLMLKCLKDRKDLKGHGHLVRGGNSNAPPDPGVRSREWQAGPVAVPWFFGSIRLGGVFRADETDGMRFERSETGVRLT